MSVANCEQCQGYGVMLTHIDAWGLTIRVCKTCYDKLNGTDVGAQDSEVKE